MCHLKNIFYFHLISIILMLIARKIYGFKNPLHIPCPKEEIIENVWGLGK